MIDELWQQVKELTQSGPIPIDRDKFFLIVNQKLMNGKITAKQKAGLNFILDEWVKSKLTDLRWLAYMLGTAFWETARTCQPVREAYWLSEEWHKLNLWYYPFYGRGFVQLTHERNYQEMTRLLKHKFEFVYPGFDLIVNKDLAMKPDVAAAIMIEGMTKGESSVGDFTGRCLEMYFNDTTSNWVGARTIINGTDHDVDIANIAQIFFVALAGKENIVVPSMLQYGFKGPAVEKLQKALANLHYYEGPIDGDFGPNTKNAVMAFQRSSNLEVDGVAGPQTQKKLGMV